MNRILLILFVALRCGDWGICLAPPTATPVETLPGISTWDPPAGTPENPTWEVEVRGAGSLQWKRIFVYRIKIGHQSQDPLYKAITSNRGPARAESSMALFDFNGVAEVRARYTKGPIKSRTISPFSKGIQLSQEGQSLTFSAAQNQEAPGKWVLRVNENWEEDCLHLLTHPIEVGAPRETDPGVYVVMPGVLAPRVLPEGKSVYYFKPGVHHLPRGAWVDFDLGQTISVNQCDLLSGPLKDFIVVGGQKFQLEGRGAPGEPWRLVAEASNHISTDLRGFQFPPFSARYVRLVLLGNTQTNRQRRPMRYLHSSHFLSFRLYETGTGRALESLRAIEGSQDGFSQVTERAPSNYFGNARAAETFYVARNGVTLYLAPGSILKGAIGAEGRENLRVMGRGILDGGDLLHDPADFYNEARTSTIRCQSSRNILVEGITILDPPMWGLVLNGSQNATVRGIHFFGAGVNADGVHMSAVQNGLVDGCFLRSPDDLFVVYHFGPAQNLTVKNSVFWTDGGRPVLLGLGNTPGAISNLSFSNLDILNVQNAWSMEQHGGALHLVATGGNAIERVFFRDIHIEPFRFPSLGSVLQFKTGPRPGMIRQVEVSRLTYTGQGEYPSFIQGSDSGHDVSDILFQDVRWGGALISAQHHPSLELRAFSSNVNFQGHK